MTLGSLWIAYNTPISLGVGIVLAVSIQRWVKLGVFWKCAIVFGLLFPVVGVLGIVKNIILALSVMASFYFGVVFIWLGGLVAFDIFGLFRYSDLAWWQIFLIGGIWFLLSQFVNLGVTLFVTIFFKRAPASSVET